MSGDALDPLSPAALERALAQCAAEPIHRLGGVQPHGVVLVFDEVSGRLTSYSDNVRVRLPKVPFAPAQSQLADWIGAALAAELASCGTRRHPVSLADGRWCAELAGVTAWAHRHAGAVLLEIEPQTPGPAGRSSAGDVLARLVDRLDHAHTVNDLARVAAEEIAAVAGYPRTMVYRFDQEWHGEVLAEAVADGSPPRYLGQHFPNSDIPAQARRLYALSHVRVLVDAQAAPARLVAASGSAVPPEVDLSHAQLRSVSPVHCEYLANMGVRATLGLSLMVDGGLWGLIMCHDPSPRHPASSVVADVWDITRLLARAIAHRLQVIELEARLAAQDAALRWVLALRARADQGGGTAVALAASVDGLQALFRASVVLLVARGRTQGFGRVLPDATAEALLAEVRRRDSSDALVMSEHLREWLDAEAMPAGLLAIGLGGDDWLIVGRDEIVSERVWGGDPAKALAVDTSGWKISPRRSFAAWKEAVTGRCASWSSSDVDGARLVATALRELLVKDDRIEAARRLAVLEAGIARANDAILITEAEPLSEPGPRILFVNPAFERMTGYRADEVIGRSPRLLQGPDTDREALARLGAALRAWQPVRMELLNYTKAGSAFWVEMDIAPVADETGWFTHWISIERDVSARKQMEAALREQNQSLERRVELRTRELSAAMERAQSANQAKSEFLANMSHELRSPLHSVLGFARLAAEDIERLPLDALRGYLCKIDRNAASLLALVNDLLDSAKIESRTFTIEPRRVDLVDIARSVLEEFSPARTGDIQVLLHAVRQVPVEGDPGRLAQALRNLVANAVRFSPPDAQVDVYVSASESGRGVIEVFDRGPGVPEAEQAMIFERFTQSSLTKTGAGGTGLGLAIARGIVELHKGSISVQNRPIGGACFHIDLPLLGAR